MVCSDEYTTARNTMCQILLQYSAGLGAPVLIELLFQLYFWTKQCNVLGKKVMNILKMPCQYIVMMSKMLIDHETTSKELLQLGWTPCFEQILHWQILSYFMFHKMDVHQLQLIFKYLPILSFTESYVYQLDTLNAKLRKSPTYGVQLGEIESYAVCQTGGRRAIRSLKMLEADPFPTYYPT
nr:uncharacterized protein LOC113732654 [Coffea arabica]